MINLKKDINKLKMSKRIYLSGSITKALTIIECVGKSSKQLKAI